MEMNHSSYLLNNPALKENLVRGYFRGEPLKRFYDNMWASGSVRSNVTDMAKYIKMILGRGRAEGGRILQLKTLAEMLSPQNEDVPLDLDFRQRLGWVLMDRQLSNAGRICNHTGSTNGFLSHVEILLDHQLGVVVLTNTEKAAVVIEAAREVLKLALKEKTGIELVTPPSKPAYSPYTTMNKEQLGSGGRKIAGHAVRRTN